METRNIETLSLNPNNDRILTDEGKRLLIHAMSMGDHSTFLITPDGMIIDGNNRWLLRVEGGWENKDVLCRVLTYQQDPQRAANGDKSFYAIIDDVPVTDHGAVTHYYVSPEALYKAYSIVRNTEAAYDDPEALANKWNQYQLDSTLFSVSFNPPQSVEFLLDSIAPVTQFTEDEPPAVDEVNEPTSKLGEVYQLGRHRLMCGDATKIEDVEKLMNGQKADMVFTDPPYNINYSDMQGKFDKIKNDKMSDEDFVQFLKDSLFTTAETYYVCCSWQFAHLFRKALEEIGKPVKSFIVWDKVNPAQHLDKYFKQHEIILYSGLFGGQRTIRGDVWQTKREVNTDHPTMKPISLIAMALNDNPEAKTVYDLFGGSGSTLIACEQTNRSCYMMELDSKYCDVIRKRYAKLVGNENGWESVTPVIN